MNNRYLVAKYVPDLKRMEPENIGVILWVQGSMAMRFLPDKDVPFIKDHANYRRWLDFWRVQTTSSEIVPVRGEAVPKNSPAFLDALRATQEGSYLLFDGGRISTPVAVSEIDDAVNFLFDDMVSRKRVAEEQDTLAEIADRAIQEAGLEDRVQTQYRLTCKMFGTPQEVTVNYAIVDDNPLAIMHRVSLRRQPAAAYAALVFDSLVHNKKIENKKHCASLINSSESDAPSLLKMLRKVSTVIDLADEASAVKDLRRLVA